jgi:hypothetical protein
MLIARVMEERGNIGHPGKKGLDDACTLEIQKKRELRMKYRLGILSELLVMSFEVGNINRESKCLRDTG